MGQRPTQERRNPRAVGTVDHAMIVGERQREGQPRLGTRHTENSDLGRIDDQGELGGAYTAQTGGREAAGLQTRP